MSIQGTRNFTGESPDIRGRDGSRIKVDLLITVTGRTVKKDPVVFLFPDRREFDFARPVQTEHHTAETPAGAPQNVFGSGENVGQKFVVSANRSVNKILEVVKSFYRRKFGANHK